MTKSLRKQQLTVLRHTCPTCVTEQQDSPRCGVWDLSTTHMGHCCRINQVE